MASAGTGKTFLLVSRLLRLLLSGARPDAILAITFTRKAAAEMHSRLNERLLQLAACDDEQLENQLRALGVAVNDASMARARRLYEWMLQQRQGVRTTTFHAFCQELLLRFPLEAQVPPGFELLEQGSELLAAAWDTLQVEASADPNGQLAKALQQLLDYTGGLASLQGSLESFIQQRGDWWAYVEGQGDPLNFATERLRQQLGIDAPDEEPLDSFFSTDRLAMLGEFAELLRKHPIKTNEAALEALALARHPELPLEARLTACQSAFLTQKGEPRARKASKAQAGKMGAEGEARLLDIHQQLCDALLALQERRRALQCWQANRAWYLAGITLLTHYQRLKREQRLLDFADLEWQACQLLNRAEQAHWVQYKLDQRIDHLLVDEFQDTNPTQWRLLLPLLEEMAAGEGEKARSVFLVGDAKQSIYRFRRAEPRLFHVARDWLDQRLQAHTFPLHTSWRSAPAIMQGVNRVFDRNGPLAGSLRDFDTHRTHHNELPGRVTVLPLIRKAQDIADTAPPTTLRNPLEQPRQLPRDDRYLREGHQIAATIEALIASGMLIGHGEDARPIHYGDIMILVSRRRHAGDYEQALREHHIPYLGAERGTLLESLEVSDMVTLLNWLTTPANNLALATILRCPLFDCDHQALISLARQGEGSWYQRLLTLELPEHSALERARTLLPHWHTLAGQLPIHDLLDRIYHEANVLQCYQQAAPAHLRSRVEANLIRFVELALDIDSGRYPSLGHFLARLQALRDGAGDAPDEAPSNDGERVRIMTIHASKGLEAPVVFLADCGGSDAREKVWRSQLHWPPEQARPEALLLQPKKELQPQWLRQLGEQEQLELEREQANLLYVAITRPRQHLYISGAEPSRGGEQSWYRILRQAIDPAAEQPMDQPCELSTGQFRYAPQRQGAKDENPPFQTDPALTRPLESLPRLRELAPSQDEGMPDAPHYLPSRQVADEDGRLRGQVVHRLLEEMTRHPAPPAARLRAQLAAEFALEADGEEMTALYEECQRLLSTPALADLFTPREGVEFFNEVPIIHSHEGQTVHGIIDRLRDDGQQLWIIDYKSHRQHDPARLHSLAESYRRQMTWYAQGAQQLWPQRQVRRLLLFTHSATLFELTEEGVERQ